MDFRPASYWDDLSVFWEAHDFKIYDSSSGEEVELTADDALRLTPLDVIQKGSTITIRVFRCERGESDICGDEPVAQLSGTEICLRISPRLAGSFVEGCGACGGNTLTDIIYDIHKGYEGDA